MAMRLTDYFIELIAYVAYFSRTVSKTQPPFERVKEDLRRLINDLQTKMSHLELPADDIDMSRFAVVAWVDETIMNSAWEHKGQWQRELLQRELYSTTDAGEQFFERINSIGPHQREVREVYYLCLAMGFKGRYCHAGDEFLIDQLKTSNLKVLTGSSVGIPSLDKGDLFPEAYPADTEIPSAKTSRNRISKFVLLGLAFPILLFLGLYAVYAFILNNVGESLIG